MLVACALRGQELVSLTFAHLQMREDRWVFIDILGKGGRLRTVSVPGAWARSLPMTCASAPSSVAPAGAWNEVQVKPGESLLCFHEDGEWNDLDVLCKRVSLLPGIHNMNSVEF